MEDITYCIGTGCPWKDTCLRYNKKVGTDTFLESFWSEIPGENVGEKVCDENFECDSFISKKTYKRNIKDGK